MASFVKINVILLVFNLFVFSQGQKISLKGKVEDSVGNAIAGAILTLSDSKENKFVAITDTNGTFVYEDLPKGIYDLKISKQGFSSLRQTNVSISNTAKLDLLFVLGILLPDEKVDVEADEKRLSTNSDNSKSGITIKDEGLEDIPDDSDELNSYLKMIAGAGAGPDGGEILVDGFSSRKPPPKNTIKEIRINSNPFSSEYESIGYGRIEIITKIGAGRFGGSVGFRFNDARLNAKNPFSLVRPPYQRRAVSADFSGSFLKNRASYSMGFAQDAQDSFADINATIVNNNFLIAPFHQSLAAPTRGVSFNTSSDFQLTDNHTLRLSYSFNRRNAKNQGVGVLRLGEQGFDSNSNSNVFRISQTSVLNVATVNEFRFQITREMRDFTQEEFSPAIIVSDSFIGGNSSRGNARTNEIGYELGDNLTYAEDKRIVRGGFRVKGSFSSSVEPTNFSGSFYYSGGLAPVLNNSQIQLDAGGNPLSDYITSIERYRRTLYFRNQGLTETQIRRFGGGANLYSLSTGTPAFDFNQSLWSLFFQDEWKVKSNATATYGLRFDKSSALRKAFNFAPRLSFAWALKNRDNKRSTTVFRIGTGVFYTQIPNSIFVETERVASNKVASYVVRDPNVIDLISQDRQNFDFSFFKTQIFERRIAENLETPYLWQTSFSIERELPFQANLYLTYSEVKGMRLLRSRNINAHSLNIRPNPNLGEVYQYESTGESKTRIMSLSFSQSLRGRNSYSIRYDFRFEKSNTDGTASFPVNQYSLKNEIAKVFNHYMTVSGMFSFPFKIRMSPMVLLVAGRPFDIIVGEDLNGDSIFNDRPCFTSDLSKPSVIRTRYGVFDRNCLDDNLMIPRNYGNSPLYATSSLRLSRRFDLFPTTDKSGKKQSGQYSLNLSLSLWNGLNTSNFGKPVGNLTSPFFGRATNLAGGEGDLLSSKRSLHIQLTLSF